MAKAKKFGGVTLFLQPRSPNWSVRWWNGLKMEWRSLGHADKARAEQEAKQLASDLLAAQAAGAPVARGRVTVGQLLDRFERDQVSYGRQAQVKEDTRRLAIWRAFLPASAVVADLDLTTFDQFKRDRLAGSVVVPGRHLTAAPSKRTVGADLEFFRRACRWALQVRVDGVPLLERNPLLGVEIPSNPSPKRPVATYDRFLALREKADDVDTQKLFGAFLDLVEALGWRVSAICSLRASDLAHVPGSLYGKLRKRAEHDKEGVEQWVPVSEQVRDAFRLAVLRSGARGEGFIFPAPRRPGQPWTRHHAKDLLERAETLAGLQALDGSDFHAYRRAWATARKHLPTVDVAAAGGWKDTATLLKHYQQADDSTLYAVMSEPRRVRAVKAS
jgi:integrase